MFWKVEVCASIAENKNMFQRLNFINLLCKRGARWAGTGGAVGLYCGMIIGVLHGVAITTVAFAMSLFMTSAYISFLLFLPVLILAIFAGGFLGAILGCVIGIMVFVVLSCSPHQFEWPILVDSLSRRICKMSLRSSFIGAFCAATSIPFILMILKQFYFLQSLPFAYIFGAIGGFAVGLFLGARSIVRENAARESSTR